MHLTIVCGYRLCLVLASRYCEVHRKDGKRIDKDIKFLIKRQDYLFRRPILITKKQMDAEPM